MKFARIGLIAMVSLVFTGLLFADSKYPAEELKGQAAPAFNLATLDGKAVSLKDLEGSVVVLDFWATWCGPCVAALPKVDELAKAKADQGVKVFAVNLREPKDKVEAFMSSKGLSLPVLMDTDGAVAKAYKAQAIPQQVVIGKDGVVRAVFIGFDPEEGETKLAAAVDEALKG